VTAGAVLGRYNRRDRDLVLLCPIFLIRAFILFVVLLAHIRVKFLGLVAVEARDISACVPAVGPVGKYARILPLVAFNACHRLFGHAPLNPKFFLLGLIRGCLGIGNERTGHHKTGQPNYQACNNYDFSHP